MNLLVNYPILILYYKNNCFREIHKKIKIPSFQISVKNFVYPNLLTLFISIHNGSCNFFLEKLSSQYRKTVSLCSILKRI